MAITDTDVEMFAARIRAYFPPELRDIAFSLALAIARAVGPKAKTLRPETTLHEIVEWLKPQYAGGKDSLDKVELVMAMEEELGVSFVLPDEFNGRTETATFRELVQHVASKERAA
jgi:acyl carrier protein